MDVIINQSGVIPAFRTISMDFSPQLELNFLASCGYNRDDPPLADLLKTSHQLEGDWAVLTPMHWDASHNDALIVAAAEDLNCSTEEYLSCFQRYADFLAEDNSTLYFHNSTTWLLRIDGKPNFHTRPSHQMIHQSLMPELGKMDSTMYWQKFFTESQMFFASENNKSMINGVWLWGNSKLKTRLDVSICADEELFSIANAVSTKVSLYDPAISLEGFQILLLNKINVLNQSHIDELNKKPTSWYWNNMAYKCKGSNWFTRFWRNLTHAN